MSRELRNKRVFEVAAVIGAYLLFLIVGLYSGNTTMSIDLVNPPEGEESRSSPIELVAKVAVRGEPLPNASARFKIGYSESDEVNFDISTDEQGMAKLTFAAHSGNYTWMVTANKQGYPVLKSTLRSFSVSLSLTVDSLLPSSSVLAYSPVDFKARVRRAGGSQVESANVTFYVDSTRVGSSLTNRYGIASLSSPVEPAKHTWFASASRDDEGGISDITTFIVGSTLASVTEHSDSRSHGSYFSGWDVRCRFASALVRFDSEETRARLRAVLEATHNVQFDRPEAIVELR